MGAASGYEAYRYEEHECVSIPLILLLTALNAIGRGGALLAACKTLASKLGTRMPPFEYRSVR